MGTLTEVRHQRILERLLQDQGVKAAAIADELGVSSETVRRDLRQLEVEGRLKRVYGGAVPLGRDIAPLEARLAQNPDGKDAMARAAAAFVEKDQWVYLSGGTPLLHVARRLADGPAVKVMTHMPAVADALIGTAAHEIHLTGGQYHPAHRILEGPAVLAALEGRLFDLAIVGAQGLHAQRGAVDVRESLSRLKRKVMAHAKRCIWLCGSADFDQEAHFTTASLAELETLVTDRPPQGALASALEAAGVTVVVAGPEAERIGA